jgi:uncharacterized protein
MKLLFEEIAGTNHRYSITDCHWFPSTIFFSAKDTTATIWVSRQDHETVVIKGEIEGRCEIVCDRCGEQFEESLQSEFVYFATTRREDSLELVDQECNEEDVFTLFLLEPIIEVDEILREQALLAIPLKNLCSEDCKGICAGCGRVLSKEPCCCKVDTSNSPFAILKKMKNQ